MEYYFIRVDKYMYMIYLCIFQEQRQFGESSMTSQSLVSSTQYSGKDKNA